MVEVEPVEVERDSGGFGFRLYNVYLVLSKETVKIIKKIFEILSRKRLTFKKTLDIIKSSRKHLIKHGRFSK